MTDRTWLVAAAALVVGVALGMVVPEFFRSSTRDPAREAASGFETARSVSREAEASSARSSEQLAAIEVELAGLASEVRAMRSAIGPGSHPAPVAARPRTPAVGSREEQENASTEARLLVESAIQGGTWRDTDRLRLQELSAQLPANEAEALRDQLIIAVNNGRMRFEGRPF